jgi:tripartite-type tricarboxylate transporter receptor subunit TctC
MSKVRFMAAAATVASAALMAAPALTHAQTAPNCSTAQLIVPWAAGGDTDIVFRAYVDAVNKSGIKPQLQVVNVGGQGGIKGTAQVKDARPDGCMLIAIHESVITSFLTGRANFTHDALDPVALVSFTPSIIGASTKAPFKNLAEMLDTARKNPKSVTAGVTLGSTSHFIFLLIEDAAKVEFRYVSYDGTRERNTALLAGNVLLGETNILTANQYMKEGSLNGLGIATDTRDPQAPTVPTLKEQGVNVLYGLARGVMAPKGTPAGVIKFWDDAFAKASKDPNVIKTLEGGGSQVMYKDAKGYGAFLKQGYEEHERLAIKIGMYKK